MMHSERAVAHAQRAAYYRTSNPARALRHGDHAKRHVNLHFGSLLSESNDHTEARDTRDSIDREWDTVDRADRWRALQVQALYDRQNRDPVSRARFAQEAEEVDRRYGPQRPARAPWPALDHALEQSRLRARPVRPGSDGVAVLIDATPREPAPLAAHLARERAMRHQTSTDRATLDRGPNRFHALGEAPRASWAKVSAASSSSGAAYTDVEITDSTPRRMRFDTCAICLVNVPMLAPPCGHLAYCHGCMATSLGDMGSAKCAVCRLPFVQGDARVVYSFGG